MMNKPKKKSSLGCSNLLAEIDQDASRAISKAPLIVEKPQLHIQTSIFVSDAEADIHITSAHIDTAKVVQLFLEHEKEIVACVSAKSTLDVVVEGLLVRPNKLPLLVSHKPFPLPRDLLSEHENSHDIRFRNCDEFAVEEVYDRLTAFVCRVADYLQSNAVLLKLKELVHSTAPIFLAAKISRLVGRSCPALDALSVITLSDIDSIEVWNVSLPEATEIGELLERRLKQLVVPAAALDALTADLSERDRCIIENRGLKNSKTLAAIGEEYGITRERVRQISEKIVAKFKAPQGAKRALIRALFFSVKILSDCEHCITGEELNTYGIPGKALLFLSDTMGRKYVTHIAETDMIVFYGDDGTCQWLEDIEKMANSLPPVLSAEEQQDIVEETSGSLRKMGFEISKDIIKEIVFHKHATTGAMFATKPLCQTEKYAIVLEKFFPDGIKVYRPEVLDHFREKYRELFSDKKIAINDHALVARIIDKCMLIDRGTYMLYKKTELPVELSQQILTFISQYPYTMVMVNAIMHRFKSELAAIGIENKYHLHGTLKQHFAAQFTFRRDYVVKGEVTDTLYANIAGFVESNPEGVSIQDLQEHFQGIPSAVLRYALTIDDNILSVYSNRCIHKKYIIFPEHDLVLQYLKEYIAREHILSGKRAYRMLYREFPSFFAKNHIGTSWFLLSILRTFFKDEFRINRPYIIDLATDATDGYAMLKSSFWGKSSVDIADIKKYAKEKQIKTTGLLKLLDSYNDGYFMLNKEKLISIDEVGYSQDDYLRIEDVLLEALGNANYAEIAKLNVIESLPRAKVPLSEWLIYSIIHKYGTRLSAITSVHQFADAVPLVMRSNADPKSVKDEYASVAGLRRRIPRMLRPWRF
ncbi:MAG: hypothetical protein FWH51_01110 [Dehalococcoidia bacterium]|nr:hypothetical protein [Dehalococcoidia bacterium]